jgi:dTDP-4-amino-4,6-dideoxygalactose transaminase
VDKAKFTALLDKEYQIETGNVFYPPCHMQTVYERLGGMCARNLSVAERILASTITLPMHVAMGHKDAEHVVCSVRSLLQHLD